MYSNRRQQTQQNIKNAFLKLYEKMTISEITVKEICKVAGINRSTFYTYYMDVYDLRDKMEQEVQDIVSKAVKNIRMKYKTFDLSKILNELLNVLHDNDDISILLIRNNKDKFVENIMDMIKNGDIFDVTNLPEDEMRRIHLALEYHYAGAVSIISTFYEKMTTEEMLKEVVEIANSGPISIIRKHMFEE